MKVDGGLGLTPNIEKIAKEAALKKKEGTTGYGLQKQVMTLSFH